MTTATLTSAQVNARISSELKKNGDTALAQAGISPTQAVRALWELAVRYKDDAPALRAFLFPDCEHEAEERVYKERERKRLLLEQGPCIVRDAYAEAGLPWPPTSAELSFDNLKELAAAERHGADLGWDAL